VFGYFQRGRQVVVDVQAGEICCQAVAFFYIPHHPTFKVFIGGKPGRFVAIAALVRDDEIGAEVVFVYRPRYEVIDLAFVW